jgi:hypothetical protein
MSTVKLLKLAPMLIMAAFLAYSIYSIHANLPPPAAAQSVHKKGLEIMVDEILDASAATARNLASEGLANPFQVRTKAGAPQSQEVGRVDPESAPLDEIVRGLTLDGTFLQGRDQLAIIDGRVYSKGQHLFLKGDSDKSLSSLCLVSVLPAKVILEGGGQSYELGYPDQLGRRADKAGRAGSRSSGRPAPQKSPPGTMSKSVIGNPNQPAPRSRRPRGARAAIATATVLTRDS